MSVERDDVFRSVYVCNDSDTTFPITFETSLDSSGNAEHIKVLRYYTSEGVVYSEILEETTEYSVSGMNVETVLTYDSDTTLIIVRNVDLKQLVSFLALGSVDLRVLEGALDKLHYIAQQEKETTARAVVADIADEDVDLTLPLKEVRAGKVATWNTDGEWLAAGGAADAPVSPFMATVVEQVDADDALTTLVRSDLGEAAKGAVRANLDVYSDAEVDAEIDSVADYTSIAVDTVLTKRGHYRVTAFCEVTLPTSLEVGQAITIKAEAPCNILQPNAENVIVYEKHGKQTIKGTGGILRLKYGQIITLTYDGSGYYYNDTFTSLGSIAVGVTNVFNTSFSPCGTYLAAGSYTASPNLQIFKRSGGTLNSLGVIATGLSNISSVAFSPCGTYLAVGSYAASPTLQVYKRSGDTFTKIGSDIATGIGYVYSISFSPCGTYLAVGFNLASAVNLQVYKRSGDTFTKIGSDINTGKTYVNSVFFSPCGTYLAVGFGIVSPNLQIYKRLGDTFTKIGSDIATGLSNVSSVAFSPCGTYLAVGFNLASPNLQIYKRSGDTFAKIGSDIATGISIVYFLLFSPDGRYLSVGFHSNTPNLLMYKRLGDTFISLGDINTGVGYNRSTSFSPCGTYVAFGFNAASPNSLWLYKMKELADYRYSVKELENAYEFELEPMFNMLPPG